MNELQATVNGLYRQWLLALSDLTVITDPTERKEQQKYIAELHSYAKQLKEDHTKEDLNGQPGIKVNFITSRPPNQHVISTKKSFVVVR